MAMGAASRGVVGAVRYLARDEIEKFLDIR